MRRMTSHCLAPLPVDNWIKFLGSTAGRDKLYRTIQYFSRFLAHYISRYGISPDLAKRLNALSSTIGMGRKLFRIGKPLDHLQTMLKTFSSKNEFLRLGTILKSTGYGGWLVLDMLQWLHASKVVDLSAYIGTINKNAPRLWLLGILASLLTNFYKIQSNFAQKQVQLNLMFRGSLSEAERASILDKYAKGCRCFATGRETKKLAKDALQDLVDLVIPLSLLGVVDVSPGVVGLAGTFTSLLGASSVWPA